MIMQKSGICVAGNIIVDIRYPVLAYPAPGELAVISGEAQRSTGGCVCNVIMDLARLDPSLPLTAFGRIGDDQDGAFILNKFKQFPNIDCSKIKYGGTTSYTLVIADEGTKQRTFFQNRGANDAFSMRDIELHDLNPVLFHIGYLMLLGELDLRDNKYGTKMARLLYEVQRRGIKTSIDLVSAISDDFKKIVPPSLKYTDYCTINEYEAAQTTGITLRDSSNMLIEENVRLALKSLLAMGVSTWAVIHSPEGGFGMEKSGEYVSIPSLKLPGKYIKGSVGAGDAFCSGVIYAAYNGLTLSEAIEMGTAAAACSLSHSSAADGMRTMVDAMELYRELRAGNK